MDGFRQCLEEEFSAIYVFNLRGNARTSGEQRRKEKGNVFGEGSRTPIAITLLVKKTGHKGKAAIHYHDIGDYLSREEKLDIVKQKCHILHNKMNWQTLQPNEHGDWLNQRNDVFGGFIPLGDKGDKSNKQTVFMPIYSRGLETARDSWVYNFSSDKLSDNVKSTIGFYNAEIKRYNKDISNKAITDKLDDYIIKDSKKISWSSSLIADLQRMNKTDFYRNKIVYAYYRPFQKSHVYFDNMMNHRVGQTPKVFPTPKQKNLVICVSGLGGEKQNTCLISNIIPDLNCLDAGTQCFPLYYYEQKAIQTPTLFDAKGGGHPSLGVLSGWVFF